MDEKFRLVLHFDVNKTLIMADPVSGVKAEDMYNSLLSECIWGTVTTKEGEPISHLDWKLHSPTPYQDNPNPYHNPPLVTYGDFMDKHCKDRKEKKRLKTSFTEPGFAGEACKEYIATIQKAMTPPPPKAGSGDLPEFLRRGQYHIVPAFFRLVRTLDNRGVDFSIIFRTFGIDIAPISIEFNLFCEGKHPFFPLGPSARMDGSVPGKPDRRLHLPSRCGKFLRVGDDKADSLLAHVSEDQTMNIARGSKNVASVINKWTESVNIRTAAILDDYDYWAKHDESDTSGKLLLIDRPLTDASAVADKSIESNKDLGGGNADSNVQVIQIFFDDNIERDRAHIVDVRYSDTYEPIPFEASRGRYLKRVEPFEVILDRAYFVKQVDSVVSLYRTKRGYCTLS